MLIDIGSGKTMTAVVPRQTAEDMGLAEGDKVVATFNPTNVILAVD